MTVTREIRTRIGLVVLTALLSSLLTSAANAVAYGARLTTVEDAVRETRADVRELRTTLLARLGDGD